MALKILCAGCPADEKERAESDVRRALGRRTEAETWMVSLVKMQGRWSVTLDGPQARGVTCVAPDGRIAESIVEALGPLAPPPEPEPPAEPVNVDVDVPVNVRVPARPTPPPKAPAPAKTAPPAKAPAPPRTLAAPAPPPRPAAPPPPPPSSGPGRRQDRHQCASCHQAFLVLYDSLGDEGEETVAVACPHCWDRNYVLVAESAAESRDYKSEKA
jgi:hypothetical protein